VWTLGLQFIDLLGQLRLEVGGFVLADDVLSGQLVEHGSDTLEVLGSLGLVSLLAQVAHCVAHGLGIVTVAEAASLGLADSLDC